MSIDNLGEMNSKNKISKNKTSEINILKSNTQKDNTSEENILKNNVLNDNVSRDNNAGEILAEKIISNIDDKYIEETLNYSESFGREVHHLLRAAGKIAACLVAAVILSVFSLSVATAAGNVKAYQILYVLYPDVATKLRPVNESCEDNGIKMEVESVCVEGDTAQVYISMQDLTGDRIDETIDLFDSYSIHTAADQSGSCSRVSYDEESKTATFLITVTQWNDKPITDSKMTFSVREFLSGKGETEEELTDILPEQFAIIPREQLQIGIERRGCSWNSEEYGEEFMDSISEFLVEDSGKNFSPVDGVQIINYGFIDNRLRIQVYYEDIHNFDNHGYVYLKDKNGDVVMYLGSVAWFDEAHIGSYEEYLFDISPEDDLSGYSVWGHFWTCKTLTKGDWKVTFPIENKEK